jgi:hypothetical protein
MRDEARAPVTPTNDRGNRPGESHQVMVNGGELSIGESPELDENWPIANSKSPANTNKLRFSTWHRNSTFSGELEQDGKVNSPTSNSG